MYGSTKHAHMESFPGTLQEDVAYQSQFNFQIGNFTNWPTHKSDKCYYNVTSLVNISNNIHRTIIIIIADSA